MQRVLQDAAEAMRSHGLTPLRQQTVQRALFESESLALNLSRSAAAFDLPPFAPDQLLNEDARAIIPTGFISETPLLRVLAVRHAIDSVWMPAFVRDFLLLALATTTVSEAGNVAFGPEVYATKAKTDVDVLYSFYSTVVRMKNDLEEIQRSQPTPFPPCQVALDDARLLSSLYQQEQIGIVITSPPYPNEKDYTRTTRLETVLLGYLKSKSDLRQLKEGLLRSNTRNVFVKDDDDRYVADITSVQAVAREIEAKRIELGKTSGFERLYHRVTTLYFGGMYRHFASLMPHLRPGARCAYVVGDQQSFFRVHIATAQLLADVALKAGFKVEGVETWRNRFASATQRHIEENVLILRKPE
ncbi:MAG: hypothetical protein JNL42_02940 [Anaerolineae bacterium]|nr:hypothetical protein [Anaerolineae bacterium]